MNTARNRIFAIGDLHLPGGDDKPMNIFGANWENHFEQIKLNWLEQANENDTILIPGDISWAMNLNAAKEDLIWISNLPGKKILIRGNHDYWWSSITQIRNILPENMYAIQNDALELDDCVFCGTRGWLIPNAESKPEDIKIFKREVARLELSINAAKKINPKKRLICLIHYPPCDVFGNDSEFTDLLSKYEINDVVYGHLHSRGIKQAFKGNKDGVNYHFVSCDGIGFKLYEL